MPIVDITLRGAREHNLKNISVTFPRNQLTVITGLSGSGKSTLVFDTLYAEGQRRYVESLSTYARQFIEQLKKPDVDAIDGLSPPIAIEQRSISRNPRSTVGTLTEIYDFLRLLYARIGKARCHQCHQPITPQTLEQMAQQILAFPEGTFFALLSPVVRGKKGEFRDEWAKLRKSGFSRALVDGLLIDLGRPPILSKTHLHNIDVFIDLIEVKREIRPRLTEAIDLAVGLSGGFVKVGIISQGAERRPQRPKKLVPFVRELFFSRHNACMRCGISLPDIEPRLFSFNSPYGACTLCNGLGDCPACEKTRLRPEARSIFINDLNIADVARLDAARALEFFSTLSLTEREKKIAHLITKEIKSRLKFLCNVGVSYLTLSRSSQTLSGGELQRIRLATQLGSSLLGVIYILDEPSIGLHHVDEMKLIRTLQALRDLGNTVIVVEHDEMMMREADFLIDMGPQGGMQGGYLVAAGTPSEIMQNLNSLTGSYLSHRSQIPIPPRRREIGGKKLLLLGARSNNLKNIHVSIPLGTFTCIAGVSGSGKSTLIIDTLYSALQHRLTRQSPPSKALFDDVRGLEWIDRVIFVDQSPIGKTPRSNPATYTGAFDLIRRLFAALPEAKVRGYGPGRFSFNVTGGRCEKCKGAGVVKIEMHFLPQVFVTCEECQGKRYNRETLEVRYKGRNISEILGLTLHEGVEIFSHFFAVRDKLQIMEEVGLGYLQLGQPAPTLSGGEAQRLKLSKELAKKSSGKTIYLLDEPTTGLHFKDVEQLLTILHRLVDEGNTVVVIEHQPDVIKSADYLIDLGPGGGDAGGFVVATGTPEEVARHKDSPTGQLLAKILP